MHHASRSPSADRLTLTVQEAAQLLGIGRQLAYEMCRQGKIPTIRLSRRILIPRAALDRLFISGATGEIMSDFVGAGS